MYVKVIFARINVSTALLLHRPRASSILVILTGNMYALVIIPWHFFNYLFRYRLYTLIKARENGPNGQYEMTEELKDSEDTILA